MTAVPNRIGIYHITPLGNLPSILANGGLMSDAAMVARGGPAATIGMSKIKARRHLLQAHAEPCAPGALRLGQAAGRPGRSGMVLLMRRTP
jgi:hypothetical protein